jgi:hypothetical protein
LEDTNVLALRQERLKDKKGKKRKEVTNQEENTNVLALRQERLEDKKGKKIKEVTNQEEKVTKSKQN